MKTTIRTIIFCAAVAFVTIAASPKSQNRLTIQRITELTAASEAPTPAGYSIEVSDLGAFRFPAPKPGESKEEIIENIREYRFPTEFDPPQPPAKGNSLVTPTTPTAFET